MKRKKNLIKLSTFLLFLFCLIKPLAALPAYAQEDIVTLTQNAGYVTDEIYRPQASIVIDAQNGQVIWEENPDLQWEPASIAKLMTIYLVFEAMKQGDFTLDTTITATDSDAAISQIYELSNTTLVSGVAYPIRDLISMTVVASSNAATVMLANFVANNDSALFITNMNTQAQALKMTNTTFFNPSGAQASAFNGLYNPVGIDPEAENVSTARDLAILGYHLLRDYPTILEFTSPFQVTVMENTPYAEVLTNSNQSIPGGAYGYEGEDGLKTGSSPNGAFNYIATAKRGETRLIEVILGVGDWSDQTGEAQRHAFGNALFDYGFSTYEYKKLLTQGPVTINEKEITLDTDFYSLIQIGTQPEFTLDDELLTFNNGLAQVSPSIPAPSVGYQIVKKDLVSKLTEKRPEKKEQQTDDWSIYLVNGVLVVAGLLLMILSRLLKKQPSGNRRQGNKRKTIRPLYLLGLFIVLVGIGLSIYTWQIGPWF